MLKTQADLLIAELTTRLADSELARQQLRVRVAELEARLAGPRSAAARNGHGE